MARDIKATIYIYIDGKHFGTRWQSNVPRAGDTIMLENDNGFVEVRRVVWASDSEYDCWVQLLCERVTNIKVEK